MEDILGQLQQIEADILARVAAFCDRLGIRYYLSSGTLLGAVRHGGFIPWDDDIDIMMPRPDYERFLQEAAELPEPLALVHHTTQPDCVFFQAKVVNTRYTLERSVFSQWQRHHVWIDVFPLDGMPDGKAAFALHRLKMRARLALCRLARMEHHGDGPAHRSRAAGLLFALNRRLHLARLLDIRTQMRKLDALLARVDIRGARRCINFYGEYKFREMFPTAYLEEGVLIAFGDGRYTAPVDADGYLRQVYGDYMRMPPEAERVQKHNICRLEGPGGT